LLRYAYDANGQRTNVGGSFARTNLPAPVSSATYDLANRVQTFDGFPATHDNNDNLLSLEGDIYAWDVRNRLAALAGPGLSAGFQYDALGRRINKTFNGQPTQFMSDGVKPLQEQAVAGANWTALTMTGLGVDEILARGDASGTYYFLPDGLGSTVALTDGAGAIHTRYTYAPFGETTKIGTVTTNPFQFTARENDNTGLYYYRARYYHPVLQRFISEDPAEFGGGDVNLYGYVGNNPLQWTDPLGLARCYYSISSHTLLCWPNDRGFIGPPLAVGPNGVFSGVRGSCFNNPACVEDKDLGPIPPGTYNMVPSEKYGGSWWLKEGWLKRQVCSELGYGRCEFFFHEGLGSRGCITVDQGNGEAQTQFRRLRDLLNRESDSFVVVTR